jgi:ligand-binding sensor domain-containing protein/signal transduction histidine kinase
LLSDSPERGMMTRECAPVAHNMGRDSVASSTSRGRRRPFVLPLLLLVSRTAPLCALDPTKAPSQYRLDAWQTEDGLPQNSVKAIVQTRDGYLWLGTLEGLARFDGVRFTIFDRTNTPGLRSNHVHALAESPDGSLWIATYGGGLTRMKDGHFVCYTTADGLATDFVRSLYVDRQGVLWIGGVNAIMRFADGVFTTVHSMKGPTTLFALGFHGDRHGNLWVATGGLLRFRDGKLAATYTKKEGLPDDEVYSVFEDRSGTVWAGASGGSLSRLSGETFVRETRLPARSRITSMLEDRQGNLWLATQGDGVFRMQGRRVTAFTTKHGLSADFVFSLYEDREGTLWIGTNGGGIARLRDPKFTVYGTPEGLSENVVSALHEDSSGAVWIGTQGGGLDRLKDGRVSVFRPADGLASDNVVSVIEDRRGSVWIGTVGSGLCRLEGRRFTTYTTTDGIANNNIMSLLEDRRGRLWIGTEDGLTRREGGRFVTFTTRDGLSNPTVISMHEDRQGTLWFGTVGGGLNRLRDGVFTPYRFGSASANDADIIRSIAEDEQANGVLWIGTNGGGLIRFENGRFTRYTTENGLFDNAVHQVLEDRVGNLWLSSNKGISRVAKAELNEVARWNRRTVTSVAYDTADGMRSPECNGGTQPAAFRARDGRLWFATMNGVAVIDPERVLVNSETPPVVIEEVLADKRALDHGGNAEAPPGDGELEIRYTALSLQAPERVRFRYRLDGFDSAWVDAGTRRTAYYTNIPPGQYAFRVIACNNDGLWNESGASFSFRLKPHVYETAAFRIAMVAVTATIVGLILYAAHRYRLGRLLQIERIRTRIATDLHDDIGASLSQIALLSELARRQLDDGPAAPLARIAESSREVVATMSDIVWAVNPTRDHLEDLVHRMRRFASDTFTSAGIDFRFQAPSEDGQRALGADVRRQVLLVFKEAVNNVARHARCSEAEIELTLVGSLLSLRVTDNGRGFAPEAALDGHGLTSMRARARELGGDLQISSTPGRGAVVSWTIDLSRLERDRPAAGG